MRAQAREYREEPPIEGPPADKEGHLWSFTVDRIPVDRYDSRAASWNYIVSEHSDLDTSDYKYTTGVEFLACSRCGVSEQMQVTGRWGDPLSYTCPWGHTTVLDGWSGSPERDSGRNLLYRLILTEADPASQARALQRRLSTWRAEARRRSEDPGLPGMARRDAEIAENTDVTAADLSHALYTGIDIRLPFRHEGSELELLLVHIALALTTPAIRSTGESHSLETEVRSVLEEIRAEYQRLAPTRFQQGESLP
ncbi:hypothetical protein [Streptomyces sp. NPDC002671]